MPLPDEGPRTLHTDAGDVPLEELRLALGGREWRVLHTGAILSFEDEQRFLSQEKAARLPYGVLLWPAAIALAHDVAARGDALRGARVLELGAGTGLPGIVAASLGAHVVQTDRQDMAMGVCRRNGERNGVDGIEHRLADWTAWTDSARYDWIIGSDIIYAPAAHEPLQHIFATNLAPGGRLLLSDPFRSPSLRVLEAMEGLGWAVTMSKWTVGEDRAPRPVGVFELAPPRSSHAVE